MMMMMTFPTALILTLIQRLASKACRISHAIYWLVQLPLHHMAQFD